MAGSLAHCLSAPLFFSYSLVLSSYLSIYSSLSPSLALSKHFTTHSEILWRCKCLRKWSMILKVTWGHFYVTFDNLDLSYGQLMSLFYFKFSANKFFTFIFETSTTLPKIFRKSFAKNYKFAKDYIKVRILSIDWSTLTIYKCQTKSCEKHNTLQV